MSIKSNTLMNIVNVEIKLRNLGIDDSEIVLFRNISKAHNEHFDVLIEYETQISPLYTYLLELIYTIA